MNSRILSITVAVGLAFSLALLGARMGVFHLPGNFQGYEPEQPIPYSHRLHAGELGIACQYCHYGAEKSRHAGIPAASVCMNCHKYVTAPLGALRAEDELAEKEKRAPRPLVSADLQKLFDAVDPKNPRPLAWNKVHNLPDFVYFDHRPHVAKGVACQSCHGPVETMERVRQVSDLSMGMCVNCHRQQRASIDCSACHY
jgi:hypothetical protein